MRYRNFPAHFQRASPNCAPRSIAIRAHLEVEIDFSDEDIRLPSRREVAAEIERLIADVAVLHDSFARGLMMREGVHATIIGKPNAGKSSLLNLLLGADRAIVTAIAGTTRDVIEDSVQLGPYALVLNDTAGVRESTDDVERIGIERTLRSARAADLLIAMFDGSRPLEPADLDVIRLTANRPGLAILNKRDLPAAISADDLREQGLTPPNPALLRNQPRTSGPPPRRADQGSRRASFRRRCRARHFARSGRAEAAAASKPRCHLTIKTKSQSPASVIATRSR